MHESNTKDQGHSEKPLLMLNDTFENDKLSVRDSRCHSEGKWSTFYIKTR